MSDFKRVIEQAEYRVVDLADIIPAPYNPRVALTPDDPEYQQIKDSIVAHGMIEPIIYNKRTGHAVGGNQRLRILKDMGVQQTVCAIVDMPLDLEKEACLAVNKIGNLWDQPKVREVMLQLQQDGYDLARTGFSEEEIQKITQDMNASVASFFDEEDEGEKAPKKVKNYKCPHCGEVFSK